MTISYARHRFAPVIMQYAARLYLRFTASYRDVKEFLAGLDLSYEILRWGVGKFGMAYARDLRRSRGMPAGTLTRL